jgi:membrane protease YdiL (CAAX protease family)
MIDPSDHSSEIDIEPAEAPSPFWTPWVTVGLGLLIVIAFVVVQILVMAVWSLIRLDGQSGLDSEVFAAAATNGDLFATATIATSLVCSFLIWLFVTLKRGARVAEALALAPPSYGAIAVWAAVTIGFALVSDALRVALDRPIVPEFMTDLFLASSTLPLLMLAIVVAAPVFEELFVRGFLLEGLRRGGLGATGAVVVTSAAWAAVHLQYDLFDITTIFVFGLVLGAARLKSGSLWVPIILHLLVNLVATVQTCFVLRGG